MLCGTSQIEKVIQIYKPDLVCSGIKDKFVIEKMGLPCKQLHSYDYGGPYASFAGAANFYREVDRMLSTKVWQYVVPPWEKAPQLAATLVHLASLRVSGRFQLAATGFKLAALLGLALAGWWAPAATPISLMPQPGEVARLGDPAFAVALFFVAYSYSGWNAAVYIGGEIREGATVKVDSPKKNGSSELTFSAK